MFKRIVFISCAGIFFFGGIGLLYSQEVKEDGMTQATVQKVEVGNKICPVSGEKIDEKLKATYEYEGKIYNFCCISCVDDFKKAPQRYVKKVEEELQAESKDQTAHESQEMEMMPEPEIMRHGRRH